MKRSVKQSFSVLVSFKFCPIVMGYVSYFYAETKTFKLSIEERYLGLRGEEGWVTWTVVLGKNCVVWLLATVEEMLNRDKLREF